MTRMQVITDAQMLVLIHPLKWKRPILSQFHEDYVMHVRQFRYGQGRRQWGSRKWAVPRVEGSIIQRPIVALCKKLDW